jgi:hypothetical protein
MRCSQLKKRNEEVVIELKSDDKTKQFGIIELAKAVFKKLRGRIDGQKAQLDRHMEIGCKTIL